MLNSVQAVKPTLACWNPRKRRFKGRIGRRLPFFVRANNFGDLLGPLIVNRILEIEGLPQQPMCSFEEADGKQKLVSIGSVLHYVKDGDLIWGCGRNGKIDDSHIQFSTATVCMVRGPKTAAFLQSRGLTVPKVYGDPALLTASLFAEKISTWTKGGSGKKFIPNLNDAKLQISGLQTIDPRGDLWDTIKAIYASDFIVSSSLHGFILAEVFGIPARLLMPESESLFKYEDYFEGTGRTGTIPVFHSVNAALAAPDHAPPVFDPDAMRALFPIDAFR